MLFIDDDIASIKSNNSSRPKILSTRSAASTSKPRSRRSSARSTPDIDSEYSFNEEEEAYIQLQANEAIVSPQQEHFNEQSTSGNLAFVIPRFIANFYRQTSLSEFLAYLGLLLTIAVLFILASVILSSQSSPSSSLVPTFYAPTAAPETAGEAVQRLLDLEENVERIATASKILQDELMRFAADDDERLKNFKSEVMQTMSEQSDLYQDLLDKASKTSEDSNDKLSEFDTSFKVFFKRYKAIQSDVEQLSKRLSSLDQTTDQRFSECRDKMADTYTRFDAIMSAMDSIKGRFDTQEMNIESLSSDLSRIAPKVDTDLVRIADIAQESALEAIDRILPDRLPVRFEEDGELTVDPAFFKYLQSAFPSQQEQAILKKEIEETESNVLEKIKFWKKASEEPVSDERVVTWEEYLEKTNNSLNKYVEAHFKGWYRQLDEREMFVDKETFLEVLNREMSLVKNELVLKIHQSEGELGKVIDETIQQSTRNNEILAEAASGRGSISLAQTAIENIVDETLQKFHDGIELKVDYADISKGARINPFLTSPTLDIYSRNGRSVANLFRKSTLNSATDALSAEVKFGNCWPFEGDTGILAIRLSSSIYLDEVAIKHIPFGSSVAPKDFEVWVEIRSDEERRLLENQMRDAYRSRTNTDIDEQQNLRRESVELKMKQNAPEYVLAGRFMYDTSGPFHLQSFRFPAAAMSILKRVPVSDIAFKFDSNWGESVTCIYKTLVYGQSAFDEQF